MNKMMKNPLNLKQTEGLKLSLFMPTHLADPENRQDPIVFKNLLKEAEEQLKEYPEGTLAQVMTSLAELPNDKIFWNYGKGGLGILASDEETKIYQVDYKVPASVKIANTYHILPLLRHMEGSQAAFVADISQDRLSLYRFDGSELKAFEPDWLETEFSDLYDDFDPDKDGHTGGKVMGSIVAFHSGSAKPEEDRIDRDKYLRYLDASFEKIYQKEKIPFILAGTTQTIAAFRDFAKGNFYLSEVIDKPLESLKTNQIRDLVIDIMEGYRIENFRKDQDRALQALRENLAETDLAKIKMLTAEGRIGELLVNEEFISKDSHEIDELIRDLYRNGAQIKPMSYDDENRTEPYLAILRY